MNIYNTKTVLCNGLEQMPLAWTNASKPKLERMQWEAWNECCITKISKWGVKEGSKAITIYTR